MHMETKNTTPQFQPPLLPKVSIGMPVYNGELFIHEALNSLLNQSFANFELIISDNGSTDSTETICKDYAEKDVRIRYVRHAENRGALANFQFVLDEAVGEYFMWAAADDIWDKKWIEELLYILVDNKTFAFGRLITINSRSESMYNPSSGNSFNFTGGVFFRRLKYYVSIPALGKANPIYGLFYRFELINFKLSTIGGIDFGGDMLLIFNFLGKLELVKPLKMVNLYKRLHDDPQNSNLGKNFKEKRFFDFILNNGKNILNYALEPYQRFFYYFEYLKFIEVILYLFLTPLLIILNILFYVFVIIPKVIKPFTKN